MSKKVAVVTGGNKGIGYAIVKGLCEKFDGDVYLTARNANLGEEAVRKLEGLGFKPKFHQLDINDNTSVENFRKYIEAQHNGLDILVNNAGIAFKQTATEPFGYQAEKTIETNYYGTKRVSEAFMPLLRNNGRIVNLSSYCGFLGLIPSADLRAKLGDSKLTREGLNELMDKFVKDAKEGRHEQEGWGKSAYVVSKIGVSSLTLIHQRELNEEKPFRNISANSVHPGYVDTDMTSHKGPLTIEEGAKAPLWLALEADQSVKGQYVWYDCQIVDWFGEKPPSA